MKYKEEQKLAKESIKPKFIEEGIAPTHVFQIGSRLTLVYRAQARQKTVNRLMTKRGYRAGVAIK